MFKTGNEKGYTMIETIMYIGFLGVLGAVLASYAGGIFRRYKTGRLTQQILELRKAVINYTAADESYAALTFADMQEKKAVPLDMRQGYHAMGGTIDLAAVGDGSDIDTIHEKYLFYITFNGIPNTACTELLLQGQFYSDGADMDTLIVNNKTIWRYANSFYDISDYSGADVTTMYNSSTNAVAIRPTPTKVVGACNNNDNNSVTWIFS